MYSNREIALLVWSELVIFIALCFPNTRKSIVQLVIALTRKHLLVSIGIMSLYTLIICAVLSRLNLWHSGMIKDTVIWFVFTALFVVGDAITTKDEEDIFKKLLYDNVKALIFIEFLLNTYTMPLIAEMVIMPLLFLSFLANSFAKHGRGGGDVLNATGCIVAMSGLLIFGYAIWSAISDLSNLGTWESFRNLIFPSLMSLLLSPLVFLMVLYSVYELTFVYLTIGKEKSDEVIRYAKWRIIFHFGLRLKRLREFKKQAYFQMHNIQTKEDVDTMLSNLILS